MVGVTIPKGQQSTNSDSQGSSERSSPDLEDLVDFRTTEMKYIERTVPVVDMDALDGPDGEKTKAEIAQACETWGFFQLINHGIRLALLERAREVCKGFFKLPEEEKVEYKLRPGGATGWYNRNLTVASNKLTHSVDHLYYFTAPESKKAPDCWPRHPAAFRETMIEYAEEVRSLEEKLMSVLSEMLGLDRGTLHARLTEGPGREPTQSMRINFYTPAKDSEDHDDGDVSLAAHSDPGGLTALLQDDVPGLQVKKNNQWINVEPIPNAFVINIGDQIEMLSNGRYKSIEHRGMAHRTKERLSIATFYSPNYEAVICPVQELVSKSHPALYKSIKYHDYFHNFVRLGLNGKEFITAATV